MHIKNAQEDADALAIPFRGLDRNGLGDQAVARRNNQPFAVRNGALRVAEEPEEERCQQNRHGNEPQAARQPKEGCRQHQQHKTVDVTVTNHCP